MKKLLYSLVLVLLVFGISACNNDDQPDPTLDTDTVSPVISGASPISVQAGSVFNPLEGVTALDDVDGSLTTSITVSGVININIVGVYQLTYTVTDAAGNVATVNRQITVTAIDLQVNLLMEKVTFDQIVIHVFIDYAFISLDGLTTVVQTIANESYLDHFDQIDGNRYTLTIYAYKNEADYTLQNASYGYHVFRINSIGNPGLTSFTNALKLA